jgi:hypothetical protein
MTQYKMGFNAQLGFNGSLGVQVTTVEQFLDQEPFSPEIRDWLRSHTEVRDALKIIIRNRFVPVHAISIVNNPSLVGVKQSVGIYSIDKMQNNQIKQDYLMHEDDDTYVLFTGLPSNIEPSRYVQHINTLENRYGPDGLNFFNDHHQRLDEVSPQVRPYIEQALSALK